MAIAKNTICVWYDKEAEAAARFYAKTFPDSAVGAIHRAPSDYPSGKEGDVLVVEFTVAGIPCIGLNGGTAFQQTFDPLNNGATWLRPTQILNPRFSRYRLPRFSDTPLIEVVLVDRKDIPSAGAGETPIVGLAPAVANAIFNATGVRLRSLPLAPSGLKT